jgi:(p)ppGpp synthase/HD superfamily hydrolase
MSTWSPDVWLSAWEFAAHAHHAQRFPGSDLPYIVHVAAVAMEVGHAIARRAQLGHPVADPDLAIACALLHDVVEDTAIGLAELERRFGPGVAAGVSALSKDPRVGDKPAQMRDSLQRIRAQPPEVWMVKLADRITNLQAPPHYWDVQKIRRYQDEARDIHAALAEACPVLGGRLVEKIATYQQYCEPSS